VLSWVLYPRRITIYLKEKGILDQFNIHPLPVTSRGVGSVPGKPPGTVPILEYAPGQYVRQSCAILEYLEDTHPQNPIMRGITPTAAARTREILDLINKVCSLFGLYCHQGSTLFAGRETQGPQAAAMAIKRVHMLLTQIDGLADPEGPFLAGKGNQPGLTDVVMLATVHFAREAYGVDLVGDHPRINIMVQESEKRDIARWDEATAEIVSMAEVFNVA
jgi:glutathione S-transferase